MVQQLWCNHIQLNENATEINTAFERAEEIYANAANSIQFIRELGMNNTARASDVLTQATDIANQAQESQNVSGFMSASAVVTHYL